MQNRNIGRFLQQALPQELESLRLVRFDRVRASGAQIWRSYFVPLNATYGTLCDFTVDMLWQLTGNQPSLQFWTVARVAMPASSRLWLAREVSERNDREEVPLQFIEHADGTLSLSAAICGGLSPEDIQRFLAPNPPRPAIEGFAQSYELASELLAHAWQDGMNMSRAYRALH